MIKRHGKHKRDIFVRLLKIAFFVMLSCAAIKLGIEGGNILSRSNINIVRNIHVETFKATLNKSIPLINTVYNSGNISISISGELQKIVGGIFQFDLDNPVTILNAQSPFLYSFYNNSYRDYLAQEQVKDMASRLKENADSTAGEEKRSNSGKNDENNAGSTGKETGPEGGTSPYLTDESSIYFPGEDVDEKERDRSDKNIIVGDNIAIKNESKFKVDDALIKKLLNEPLKFKFEDKGTQILIYHTHTSESYLRRLNDIKMKDIPSSWTTDNRYNVVRVGDELAQYLRKTYNFNVMHNGTVNDYKYVESYNNARKTVNNILKGNPSIKVVIDIHRDGLDGKDKLRKVGRVNGKNAAQLMFVIGTNHSNWKENFKLAIKLQERLNSYCPNLVLPINLRNATFNQNVRYGAFIIEVGGDGNTLDEALISTQYLAKALNDVLGELK